MDVSPLWQVGAILNEPVAATLRFVAWYLEQGARQITLLLDDPEDPVRDILADHPSLRCLPCTADFWAARGMSDEPRFPKRQNAALTWLYHQYGVADGWFLNVDADEYMYAGEGVASGILARCPDDVLSVRVTTAEAVSAEGQGNHFRLPMTGAQCRSVYGAEAELFARRRMGLVGHPQGKSFTRCGHGNLRLRQHWPEARRRGRLPEHVLDAASGSYLLHVIGVDYLRWREKLDWRRGSSGFAPGLAARIEEILPGPDPEVALVALHRALHCADAALLQRLQAERCLLTLELRLDQLVARHFGAQVAARYL